ncbi:hypothetical protein SNE40_015019 [Patella caerulea]|uniref:Phosphatidylinositol N-acetylglucosaminyltransferase subunit P n=1 Tax=Patella caerulea TaxID=87958 RepID=A0AAN8PRD1_PATCE
MAEHSPSPSPQRAFYGFVLYLVAHLSFVIYVIWAFLPEEWLHTIGFTYYPSRHWAVTVPIGLLVIFILAFPVYMGLSLYKTAHLTSLDTITDNYAIHTDVKKNKVEDQITPIADLCISDVNRRLYLNQETQYS